MRTVPWVLLASACAGSSPPDDLARADVVGVRSLGGSDGAVQLAVSVRSDETVCGRYADWWEVLDPDGALIFRRILDHSHPDEQPFERDGGPVPIAADDGIVVRAHLLPVGYRGTAQQGSLSAGFEDVELPSGFAAGVEALEPQPEDCLF